MPTLDTTTAPAAGSAGWKRSGKAATGSAGKYTATRSARSAASGSAWKWAATRAAAAAGTSSATRLSPSARTAGLSASPGTARLRSDVDECPLVVMVPALVETNRLFLALAHHAHHSAGHGAAEPRG